MVTTSDGMTSYTTSIFRLSRDNLLLRKKIKLYSHRDINNIMIILKCPLLLINVYKFSKHNSHKSKKRNQDVCNYWKERFTLSWVKADIVKLVNVSQHKGGWVRNGLLWMDNYFTIKAADNTDGSLKVVC